MILRSQDAASAHTALAAVLVWIDPAFGVFVYVGFLYSYGLGPRWRIAGFTATALVVSAALSGGYPSGRTGPTLAYMLIAAVLVAWCSTRPGSPPWRWTRTPSGAG